MAVRKSRKAKRSAPVAGPRRKKAAAPKGAAARKATGSAARRKATAARAVERRKRERETLRLRAFEPSITVSNLDQSTRYYTDVLGFIVGERWEDEGVLKGVMLKAGVCTLGLSQDDWAKGRDRQKGEGVRIWCQTSQDIDELAARIKQAGGRLAEEPADQWGMRTLSVDDPDGFHLTIYRKA